MEPCTRHLLRLLAAAAFALVLAALAQRASAHAGELDPTFGGSGIVILPNLHADAPFDTGDAVAVQADGKIVVVGRWGAPSPGPTFAIARFNPNGTLDGSFGFGGLVTLSSGYAGGDEAHAVAIAPASGNILVGGNFGSHAGVYRLKPAGILDTSFGSGGAVLIDADGDSAHTTTLNALVLDGSGGTLFAGVHSGNGPAQFALGWLASSGTVLAASSVSLGFGDRDQIATSLVHQADGKLVVAGYADLSDQGGYGSTYCAVARYQPTVFPSSGFSPDAAYGDGGGPTKFFSVSSAGTTGCYVDALALLADGSTLAGGREPLAAGGWVGMDAQLDTSGQIVPGFIGTPHLSASGDNSIRKVVVQADGKPVLVGYTGVDASGVPGPVAVRLTTNGQPDAGYGNAGETLIDFDPNDYASGQALGAALDAHGRVVIAGIYFNGNSGAGGQDVSQIFVARLQSEYIFANGFDP